MLFALPCNFFYTYAAGGLLSLNKDSEPINIKELTIDENIILPEVISNSAKRRVCEFVTSEVKRIKHNNKNYSAIPYRGGEVIKVTIPMDMLFYPNETTLSTDGNNNLKTFARYLRDENFKVIVATHSDNTGSATYNENLTTNRAVSIYNWLINSGGSEDCIAYYGLSNTEPLVENNSMANRALNRRCDIYIIPNAPIIRLANKKSISLL